MKTQVPKYLKHSSGQARVLINGKAFYLGKYGSKASKQRYDTIIAEYLSTNRSHAFGLKSEEMTLGHVMLAFLKHAKGYYSHSEYERIKYSLRPLNKLYASLAVSEFGPVQFKAVRHTLIQQNLARTNINASMKRIARMMKWGAAEGHYPAAIYETLSLIPSLARGRTEAKESAPVKPVCEQKVAATIKHCTPVVADMVRLQLLTGSRPGEVCKLTPAMIDRSGAVWEAKLDQHKTSHHGKPRIIYFGPEAQKILMPYLLRDENEHLFKPSESKDRQWAKRTRSTPKSSGNRVGYSKRSREGRSPKRAPGLSYTSRSYAKSITYACKKAFPEPKEVSGEAKAIWRKSEWWSPNQLRHTAATTLRKEFGLEIASVILGHSKLETSQVYAEEDREKAKRVASKIG